MCCITSGAATAPATAPLCQTKGLRPLTALADTAACSCMLLDDNRELFVPELQAVVRPHSRFMLFATQNPAGAYGGRKAMSRAFRSRFLELHVGDIPDSELSTILHERCAVAPSHAGKLVAAMRELQRRRQV